MDKNIIFIDGHCLLCNQFATFIFNRDSKQQFYFTTLQGDHLAQLCQQVGHTTKQTEADFKTVVVYFEGQFYMKSAAVQVILSNIAKPWSYLGFCIKGIPSIISDYIYDIVAKYRYAIVGKKQSCSLDNTAFKQRILQQH